jgi:hypothetical protein
MYSNNPINLLIVNAEEDFCIQQVGDQRPGVCLDTSGAITDVTNYPYIRLVKNRITNPAPIWGNGQPDGSRQGSIMIHGNQILNICKRGFIRPVYHRTALSSAAYGPIINGETYILRVILDHDIPDHSHFISFRERTYTFTAPSLGPVTPADIHNAFYNQMLADPVLMQHITPSISAVPAPNSLVLLAKQPGLRFRLAVNYPGASTPPAFFNTPTPHFIFPDNTLTPAVGNGYSGSGWGRLIREEEIANKGYAFDWLSDHNEQTRVALHAKPDSMYDFFSIKHTISNRYHNDEHLEIMVETRVYIEEGAVVGAGTAHETALTALFELVLNKYADFYGFNIQTYGSVSGSIVPNYPQDVADITTVNTDI